MKENNNNTTSVKAQPINGYGYGKNFEKIDSKPVRKKNYSRKPCVKREEKLNNILKQHTCDGIDGFDFVPFK